MIDPKIFRGVRKALGLTQQDLADAIGISRVTVNKMEQGKLKRGIPDDVGARLLALKARPERVAPICGPNVQTTAFDDKSLWDNEEDES